MNYPTIGAKTVYVDDTNNVLLVRRGPTAPSRAGDWELPGGFVESNEEPIQTATREGSEEVGIEAKNLIYVYAHTVHTKNFTGFYFLEQLESRPEVKISYEHDDYKWMPLELAIKTVTVPLFKFAIANAMNYILTSNPYEQIVSTKAILSNGGHNLALKRSENEVLGKGLWDLPGGRIEDGETIDRAIKREVREETGLVAIDPKIVFAHTQILEHERTIRTRIGIKANVNIRDVVLSDEHDAYKWLGQGQMFSEMEHPNWPGWGEFVKSFG